MRADGRPLVFMPAGDFHGMSDADAGVLIACMQSLRSLPPIESKKKG